MKKYVIVGNGAAAVGCAEGIRSVDREGEITVISAENRHVYCRPLISYYLEGKTDEKKMKYRPDEFYTSNGCKVLYGVSAERIDSDTKTVLLSNGDTVGYDELCIAAGSSPFVPPMEGLGTVGQKYSFMTLDDALSIEKAIKPESRVLIVGAGLIGLKCAEGIHGRVKSITVCDLADRVLSSILDAEGAETVQKYLEDNGLRFLLGDSVARFEGGTAHMKSGKTVDFDILVLAVGVRANTSLVKDIGGVCGRGITIDERMKTSLDSIYAAGDCTESVDVSDGRVKVMALMPNAYLQGRCAGINMAGGDSVFDNAIPMNSIGFFGLHIMTAGSREGCEVYEERADGRIKKLFTKDGFLVGFMLIGDTARAGIYTNMIRNRVPLDEIDFDSLKKVPNLFAFNAEYRRNKLGGVV